jgi:acetyl-CoA C-acetyltransferase
MGHAEVRDSMWDSLTSLGIGPAMGITAENLAEQYGISREAQDEFALFSHGKAVKAIDQGRFKEEIVPVEVRDKKTTSLIDTDEHPRRDMTLEAISKLKPSFKPGGTVTAANASGINDGSAGLILMSEQKAKELGLKAMARIVSTATTGVAPDIMGIGPVSSTRKALEKAGLELGDMELVELNEAFAAQYLACEMGLGLNRDIANVNGGGIGLGHPVGATTLIHEMIKRRLKLGLASLCAGGGMGTSLIVETLY